MTTPQKGPVLVPEIVSPATRMIGYLRVSTDEQAANLHGVAAQRAAIQAEAARRSWPHTSGRPSQWCGWPTRFEPAIT